MSSIYTAVIGTIVPGYQSFLQHVHFVHIAMSNFFVMTVFVINASVVLVVLLCLASNALA